MGDERISELEKAVLEGVKGVKGIKEVKDFKSSGELVVKEVVVMESRLRPTGSVYTPLSRIPITKNKNREN